MKLIETAKPVRRSWVGGPLIQCHLPMTSPSVKYVCDGCHYVAHRGVRIRPAGINVGLWLCWSCEEGRTRTRGVRPATLAKDTSKFSPHAKVENPTAQ
jgi:hypothetical protein